MKRVALLMNEAAGSVGSSGDLAETRALELGWDVHRLAERGARATARDVAHQGYELVVAGGGDGTVREVVQGLVDARADVSFGVLPLGTGNDLARSLRMPLDVEGALEVLARSGDARLFAPLDLLQLTYGGTTSVCANSVNGGIAPLIREQMDPDLKAKLGPLAFIWGALSSLTKLTRWPVRYRIDGGPIRDASFVAFVIANGSSVGGGAQVAPGARLDDGAFDLVVVHGDASIAELTIAAIQTKFGDLFKSDCVEHVKGRQLEIVEQPPDLAFTVDGDPIDAPLESVRVLPAALRAVLGSPEPEATG
ncbi:MAG TPA: diacylglycerol kinase family protein [Polyangiaceae bacterium]|nr:diacylglycerol kinase family protein [Polyangiaceae bacterium]